MKCFKLENGDIVISNNAVQIESGYDLLASKIKQVLSTNLGEWEFDENEGVDFYAIVTKNPNHNLIRDYIKSALYQVDTTLELIDYVYNTNKETRKVVIDIKIATENGTNLAVTANL